MIMRRSTLLTGLVLGLSAAVAMGAIVPEAEAGPRRGRDKKTLTSRSKARAHQDHPKARSQERRAPKAVVRSHPSGQKRGQVSSRYGYHDRRDHPRVAHRTHRPAVRYHSSHPWYRGTRSIVVDDCRFYFHTGFQVYVGGIALDFEITNYPPYGYAYYDPYCGETFVTLEAYGAHRRHHRHHAALTLVPVDVSCGWGR
jgi:hypothetical protein